MVWPIHKRLLLMEARDSGRRDRWVATCACCLEHTEPGRTLHSSQGDPHVSERPWCLALSSAGHGWMSVLDAGLDEWSLPNTASSQPQL